ncbi:hypothetical protein KPL78_12730 [Roseomonas sp. HJA6]|uniref:Tetratricopeptide repeat protein n=1 Tax=Roseomonas alba TaxID=2846776 RepID=A0ABS7A8X4_9PROT|nr:hypothetical protein [Neoroseomonas alba]MBW6398721.1 hypothetical protein [Neoroseomonas alba]
MTVTPVRRLEALWFDGDDAGVENAMAETRQAASADPIQATAFARVLLGMGRMSDCLAFLHEASSNFPNSSELAEAQIDASMRLGDVDTAMGAFHSAQRRGLLARTPMLLRVMHAAVMVGRIPEMERLVSDSHASPFLADAKAILSRERIIFDHFEERRLRERGDAPPTHGDLIAALSAKDVPYTAHLKAAAARSDTITEEELVRIVPVVAPIGNVVGLRCFACWRLLRRFPTSHWAKMLQAIHVHLYWGDAYGARALLDDVLLAPDADLKPGIADMALRLATSCAMFGALEECRVAGITGRLWPLLHRKDFTMLAAGFAARRASMKPRRSASRDTGKRPRVAVCISGQLRSFRTTWPITRATLKEFDATVFVVTWNKTGAGFGTTDTIQRKLPVSLRGRLPAALQMQALFASRYPQTFSLFNESDTITAEECSAFFETPHVYVRDEDDFEETYSRIPGLTWQKSLNQAKMFAGIHTAVAMKERYEAENNMRFDVVLRMRPDMALRRLSLRDLNICTEAHTVMSTHIRIVAVGDAFLIMSPEVANIVGGMWPEIERMQRFSTVPGASGDAAESALGETLCWNGIRVLRMRGSMVGPLESVTVPSDEIWRVFRADVAALSDCDRDDLTLASTIHEDAGFGPIGDIDALRRLAAG